MAGLPGIAVLQQQQCEVAASLRVPINSSQAAEGIANAVTNIELFMRDVHDAAAEMSIGVEQVVQALLLRLQEAPKNFDQQGGSGAVPMHQNKILDRSKRVLTLDTERVKDVKWILKQVQENLPKLLDTLKTLRDVVKIKVEDASDIIMARKWSTMASTFFRNLLALSASTGGLYQAWCAVEQGKLPASEPSSPTSMRSAASVGGNKSLQLLDYSPLLSLAAPFQDRLNILAAITSIEPGSEAERVNLEGKSEALGNALVAQLKDNRSQILKAVCHAVKRVVRTSQWGGMSVQVTGELIGRLNVANKMLANEVAGTLKAVATSSPTPEVVLLLCTTCEGSQLAPQQTRSAEALASYLAETRPQERMEHIVKAAEVCSQSRHVTARTAGKALAKAAEEMWGLRVGPQTVQSPPRNERVVLTRPGTAQGPAKTSPSPRKCDKSPGARPKLTPVKAPAAPPAKTSPAAAAVAAARASNSDSSAGGVSSSGSSSPRGLSSPDSASGKPGSLLARGPLAKTPLGGTATPVCGSPVASLSMLKKRQHEKRPVSKGSPPGNTDSPLFKKQKSLSHERPASDAMMADADTQLPPPLAEAARPAAGSTVKPVASPPKGLRKGVRLL